MESKDLSWLGTKQKRLQSWRNFVANETPDPEVKEKTDSVLRLYAAALTDCWEKNVISDDEKLRIANLERELEQLNDEARLRVVAKKQTNA